MPFVATWLDLAVTQTVEDKRLVVSLTCGILKRGTHELVCRTEVESQTPAVTKASGRGVWYGLGVQDWHMHMEILERLPKGDLPCVFRDHLCGKGT